MRSVFTVTGQKRLVARLQKMKSPKMRELYIEAEEIMAEAKALTPVDTGALRASGYVKTPNGNTIELGFGGPAVGYAVVVHEDLGAFHKVGQAKYLEQPLQEHFSNLETNLGSKIGKSLEGA